MHLLVDIAMDSRKADVDMNTFKILLICTGLFNF